MVAYSDVPAVNALYDEQARVQQGIALIDAGGTVSSFTIMPPPPQPNPSTPTMMMMSVSIGTINPTTELMVSVRESLVARDVAISAELAALGVTATPEPPPPPPEALRRQA